MSNSSRNENKGTDKSEVAATLALGSSTHHRQWSKRTLIFIALLAVGGALLGWWWQRDTPAAVPQYKIEKVRRGDLKVIVTATGNLAPVNQVQVGSELSGIVKSVEVDYNDHVKVGQVLARLDTSKLEAQKQQSRASLEAAQADLDRAVADQANAEATVSQNEAALKAIETDLAKTVIHSPINGVVLTRSVDPGQTVAASLQAPVLFTLAEDLTKMQLHVDVDEADVGQVKEGQAAVFTVDAYPDRSFPARISQVRYGSKTVDGVVTYETLLDVDNSDLSLRPGMTGTANITVKELHDALLVPNAALRFVPPVQPGNGGNGRSSGGRSILSRLFPRPHHGNEEPKRPTVTGGKKIQRVWIVRDGKLTPISVTTGATNGAFTEITSANLDPGQELVVDTIAAKS